MPPLRQLDGFDSGCWVIMSIVLALSMLVGLMVDASRSDDDWPAFRVTFALFMGGLVVSIGMIFFPWFVDKINSNYVNYISMPICHGTDFRTLNTSFGLGTMLNFGRIFTLLFAWSFGEFVYCGFCADPFIERFPWILTSLIICSLGLPIHYYAMYDKLKSRQAQESLDAPLNSV